MDLYVENAPQLIDAIRRAIAAGDAPALQRSAHTLKGSSASLGAQRMAALCFELEKLGRDGTVEGALPIAAEVEQEFDRVRIGLCSAIDLNLNRGEQPWPHEFWWSTTIRSSFRLRRALTASGYEVFKAASGPEALRQVDDIRPDLIILDVMMPEMDGYEVCRRLRNTATTARLPIMMLTAQESVEEKVRGFEAGADDYMTKPFQPPELQARVKVLLRRALAHRGRRGDD